MPIARFQMVDGRIGRFEVPEGTTPEQAQKMIGDSLSPKEEEPKKKLPSAEWQKKSAVTQWRGEHPVLAGIGDVAGGMSGLSYDILNKISPGLGEKAFPQDVVRDTGYKTAGELLDPAALGLFAAGGGAATYIPKVGKYAQGIAGGLLGGGAIGGLSEEGSATSGGLFGAGAMAVLPPALKYGAKLAQYPYRLIEKILPGGSEQMQGRALNKAAESSRQAIIADLQRAGKGLTAGQATVEAGSPKFAALQEKARQLQPQEYDLIKQTQEAERLASLRSIGRDSPHPDAPKSNMTIALSAREKVANRLYGDAFAADDLRIIALKEKAARAKGGIAQGQAAPILLDVRLKPLTGNKIILDVADEVAKKNPAIGNPVDNLRGLDQIKKMIDEDIFAIRNKLPTAIQNATEANLNQAKSVLLKSMEDLSPTYGKARLVFSEKSVPVNQMQIGQVLEDALSSTVGTAERGTVFANKVRDAAKIIATKTGQARYDKLSELFTPAQMGKVNKVIYELNRDARLKELTAEGMTAINKQLGDTSHQIKTIGLLKTPIVIMNSLINRLQGGTTEKTLEELAVIMRNPKLTAELMQMATAKEKAAMRMIEKAQIAIPPIVGQSVNVSQQEQQ